MSEFKVILSLLQNWAQAVAGEQYSTYMWRAFSELLYSTRVRVSTSRVYSSMQHILLTSHRLLAK